MYKNVEENGKNTNTEKYYDSYSQSCSRRIDVSKQEQLPISILILIFAIYMIVGVYAAKLSWYSNTRAGWSQGYKVLFAIIAFMFPFTYITAHILFKLDLLSRIKGGSKSF